MEESLEQIAKELGKFDYLNLASIILTVIATAVSTIMVIITYNSSQNALKQSEKNLANASKIAEKQNVIAIFEKRYEVYEVLQKYLSIAMFFDELPVLEDVEKMRLNIVIDYLNETNVGVNPLVNQASKAIGVINKDKILLERSEFLFSKKIAKQICEITYSIRLHLVVYLQSEIYRLQIDEMEKTLDDTRVIDDNFDELINKRLFVIEAFNNEIIPRVVEFQRCNIPMIKGYLNI